MSYDVVVDVSNWQPADLASILETWQPDHVVVRASTESEWMVNHAKEQLRAVKNAKLGSSIYVWCDWTTSPEQYVTKALSGIMPELEACSHIFFDAEVGEPTNLDDWLSRAVDMVERQWGFKAGIYTRTGWWNSVGGSDQFGRLPLWLASYDHRPTLEGLVLPPGWDRATGHQWIADEIGIDLSVFASGVLEPPVDLQSAVKHALDGCASVLAELRDALNRSRQ